jgi:hypothetical protein
LVHCTGPLVLDERGQPEIASIQGQLDREGEWFRRQRLAFELDELVSRLPRREARDQRLADVLARRNMSHDEFLAEYGAD